MGYLSDIVSLYLVCDGWLRDAIRRRRGRQPTNRDW